MPETESSLIHYSVTINFFFCYIIKKIKKKKKIANSILLDFFPLPIKRVQFWNNESLSLKNWHPEAGMNASHFPFNLRTVQQREPIHRIQ